MKLMTWITACVLWCGATSASALENKLLPLMPWPQSVEQQEGFFALDAEWHYQVEGIASLRIDKALHRFSERVSRITGNTFTLQALPSSRRKLSPQLTVQLVSGDADNRGTSPGIDESYALTVTTTGIMLHAETVQGAMHGLETLSQLVQQNNGSWGIPAVTIQDAPRFIWRGALLDVSRHFMSLEALKRQIDGMAAAKLNIFHWHITDDQGWRMESRRYPRLHQQASGGQYFTQEQIRELVAYAWDRGIHVLPEIDMPGHVSALAIAYPELMSAPGPYAPEDRWGVLKPLLNPANDEVYTFIENLLGEVKTLFPFDYIHIGGDEVDPEHWQNNTAIRDFMQQKQLADTHALQAYFNRRVSDILTGLQKKMIGWDEILHQDLPRDIVIQSWQGQDALGNAVNQGFQGILSTGFYLDQPQTSAYHYRNEPVPQALILDQNIHPGENWQSWQFSLPRKRGSAIQGSFTLIESEKGEWRGYMDFAGKARRELKNPRFVHGVLRFELDTWMGPISSRLMLQDKTLGGAVIVGNAPYAASGKQIAGSTMDATTPPAGILPVVVEEEQVANILGGELALWAEMINETVLDLRLWPRGFVVGERLWSAQEKRDEDHLYHRLNRISDWSAIAIGLQHLHQQEQGLKNLGIEEIQPTLILSQAIEQAQYYHRHHEKSAHATYSRKDPLNLFVDTLPAESLTLYQLQRAIDYWLPRRDDAEALRVIRSLLESWVANYPAVLATAGEKQPLIKELAQQVQMVSRLGLYLLDRIAQQQPLTEGEVREAQAILTDAMRMREEVVVSVAFPVESLLDAAR